MNVYDFDKTIYRFDSSKKFYFYCLKRHKKLFWHIFVSGFWGFLRVCGIIDLFTFKQKFFSFVRHINDIDKEVREFWDDEIININTWYFEKRKKRDVICSASPEFLIKEIAGRINETSIVVCSLIDKKTGLFENNSKNCKGEEKVRRLRDAGFTEFEEGYGDSISDVPMISMSKKHFRVVKDGKIIEFDKKYFEKYEKNKKQSN